MKKIVFILFMAMACVPLVGRGQVDIIETIANKDTSAGYGGDGGPAITAKLHWPVSVCYDKGDKLYIADAYNCSIRKIELSTGLITTVAGIDSAGYSGDNGLAVNAKLYVPEDVCVDTSGNIYIADAGNSRIRKITILTGVITTVAGNGMARSSGDNNLAVNAELNEPSGVCVDNFGNIFIADNSNNKIRKVDGSTGIISTVAGTGAAGYIGDNGLAVSAELNSPYRITVDSFGNILFSDAANNAVRKVNVPTGVIPTFAGNGTIGYAGDNGPARSAQLNQPSGLFIDKANNLLIAEFGNGVIRKVDGSTNIISTMAGNGTWGYSGDNGPAIDAEMICEGICLDQSGVMYIADYGNNCIRKVYNPTGIKEPASLSDFKIYPNPTSGKFTIQTAVNKHCSIDVCNVVGDKIYHGVMDGASAEVDISSQEPGVYFVYVVSGDDPSTGSQAKVVRLLRASQ